MLPVPGDITRWLGTTNEAWAWSKPLMSSGWPERALETVKVPASP